MTEENTTPSENEPKEDSKDGDKKKNNKVLIIVIILVGALIILGFAASAIFGWMGKKVVENVIENTAESSLGEGADVDIDEDGYTITNNGTTVSGDENSYSMTSDDGSIKSGTAAELPSDWPSNIPEYSGSELSSTTDISGTMSAYYESTDSVSDVASYLKDKLEKAGYIIGDTYTTNDSYMYTFSDNTYDGSLNVYSYEDGKTTYAIILGPKTE
ncbi:MAG: hypothetical protein ABIE68_02440 [bacterium]